MDFLFKCLKVKFLKVFILFTVFYYTQKEYNKCRVCKYNNLLLFTSEFREGKLGKYINIFQLFRYSNNQP